MSNYMGVIIHGVPPNGWFTMENPMNVDDDWGVLLFQETSQREIYNVIMKVHVEGAVQKSQRDFNNDGNLLMDFSEV